MISKDKQYKTRDGREVRIYAMDGGGEFPIHGAIKYDTGWDAECWGDDGIFYLDEGPNDLIEVRPRIKRELWCNVYKDSWVYSDVEDYLFETREEADESAGTDRFACVKVVIDCEEGEGL